ncbi:MAG: hypothetical protein HY319_12110 [Armatimonadetes bacterium]|nr:hypothetical protein [Armatimonadota bacterium]
MHGTRWLLLLWFVLTLAPASAQQPPAVFDLHGESGILNELRPTGVVWLDSGRLFVVDRRYNAFAIFDTQGRRIGYIEPNREMALAEYSALGQLETNVLFAAGSHYHDKNNTRYLYPRSVIHRIEVTGSQMTPRSTEQNYTPDRALRATNYYGGSPKAQMEIQGIAFDEKHNRMWIGLSRPLAEDGTILIYEAPLDEFLARKEILELEPVKTGLKPEIEPSCGTQFYLSDLAYVPDKGLLLLLTSDTDQGRRFCSNQIWFMKGGFGPAKLVRKEIAPGNRATGMALWPKDKWTYRVALVADNNPEETKIPSRLILLEDLPLKLK